MQLRFDENKVLHTQPIARLFREGEKNVESISILGPGKYNDIQLSRLNWIVYGNFADYEETALQMLEASDAGDSVQLLWVPDEGFTAHAGGLKLYLAGTDESGEQVIKICGDGQLLVCPTARHETVAAASGLEKIYAAVSAAILQAKQFAAAAKSWAIGEGMDDERPDEGTENAKTYAAKADASTKAAAKSAADASASEANAKLHEQAAGQNADRADAAADSAAGDAERAEAAAKLAQAIAQGQKGYYPTPADLKAAFPSGEDGDWAIVGSTDTIWIWDSDDGQWEDSGNKTDLSNYYTKEEVDDLLNELQTALGRQITEATTAITDAEIDAMVTEIFGA